MEGYTAAEVAPHSFLEDIHFEVDRAADLAEAEGQHNIGPERPEAGVGHTAGLAAVGCILAAAGMVAGREAADILGIAGIVRMVGMVIDLGRQDTGLDTGLDTAPGEVLDSQRQYPSSC